MANPEFYWQDEEIQALFRFEVWHWALLIALSSLVFVLGLAFYGLFIW